jgi:hypothetical protein
MQASKPQWIHSPTHWVCASTLNKWNKNIATLLFQENCPSQNISRFFGFGIMVDESTRGGKKLLIIWNAIKNRPIITAAKLTNTVSGQALQICNETSIDPKKCHFWLTDNGIRSWWSSNSILEGRGKTDNENSVEQVQAILNTFLIWRK